MSNLFECDLNINRIVSDIAAQVQSIDHELIALCVKGEVNRGAFEQLRSNIHAIQEDFSRSMALNSEILTHDREMTDASIRIDRATGKVIATYNGVEAVIPHPFGQNVAIRGPFSFSAFRPGVVAEEIAEDQRERHISLASSLESFYMRTHLAWKLLEQGKFRKEKRKKFIGVQDVRNNLINHPNDSDLYSFSASSCGPKVKNWYTNDAKPKTVDKGLVGNYQEFLVHARLRICEIKQSINSAS